MAIVVSKSDYLRFRDCHKNAWLKIHRPDIYNQSELSAFDKALMETGNEVELVARKRFPTGILIDGRDKAAQELTKKYIEGGQPTIFQAVFEAEGFLAALDVLKIDPKDGSFIIYEIKSTNDVDEKAHYHDLAFQVNLLRKLGYKIKSTYLIHLNAEYVRMGDLDPVKLFEEIDVTSKVEDLAGYVLDEMQQSLNYLSQEAEPKGFCECINKGRSNHCSTFKYSNPQVPAYGVHDISRIGSSKAKLQEMVDGNCFDLKDIPEYIKLSEIQQNQVNVYVSDRPLVHKDKIAEELEGLIFPLYFLDYETYPCAIPRYDGFKPYQQIPFQYSLHVLDSEDAEPRHYEYLCTEPCDPSNFFAESLRQHIGAIGTIVVWSKKFECRINEELGQRLPGFKELMNTLNGRVYDLMDIFTKQYFVHKDFKGKTSIKYILTVLAPRHSYKTLGIQEGGTASQSWNELVTAGTAEDRKQKIIKDLREYCDMDTKAMYAIWNVLRML